MISLTTLYDEYIGRPNLSEQKNPFEYIVPPSPLTWGSEQLPLNSLGYGSESVLPIKIIDQTRIIKRYK